MRVAIAIVFLILATPALASECKGEMKKIHRVGTFNFETNSWVEQVGPLYRYVSCVRNLDDNHDLRITWYIPGPNGEWIPEGETGTQPRLSEDGEARPLEGCIEYGNLGERTVAQFMGNGDDKSATESYTERNCRAASKTPTEAGIKSVDFPKDGWTDEIRYFFPSDPERPRETMLVLNGRVSLQPVDGGYQNVFAYDVSKFEGRPDGNPDSVFLRPHFPAEPDFFLAAMKGAFSSPDAQLISLGPKGEVAYYVPQKTSQWLVTSGYYELLDKDSKTLGVLRLPLFAPDFRQ